MDSKTAMLDVKFGDTDLFISSNSVQGDRKYMEDVIDIQIEREEDSDKIKFVYLAVFDGHGGREAADFGKEHLLGEITKLKGFWSENDEQVMQAIRDGFITTHKLMWKEVDKWSRTASGYQSTAGSTCSVTFIMNNKLYIGHVGDSGAMLGIEHCPNRWDKYFHAHCLTEDHKPEYSKEIRRIVSHGGEVMVKKGVHRVVWQRPKAGHHGPITRNTQFDSIPFLAIARALGDLWSYNREEDVFVVSPEPDVSCYKLDPNKHRLLIVASDGLWNMAAPYEIVGFMHPLLNRVSLNLAKCLVDTALHTWQVKNLKADNTSAIIVKLTPCKAAATVETPCTVSPSIYKRRRSDGVDDENISDFSGDEDIDLDSSECYSYKKPAPPPPSPVQFNQYRLKKDFQQNTDITATTCTHSGLLHRIHAKGVPIGIKNEVLQARTPGTKSAQPKTPGTPGAHSITGVKRPLTPTNSSVNRPLTPTNSGIKRPLAESANPPTTYTSIKRPRLSTRAPVATEENSQISGDSPENTLCKLISSPTTTVLPKRVNSPVVNKRINSPAANKRINSRRRHCSSPSISRVSALISEDSIQAAAPLSPLTVSTSHHQMATRSMLASPLWPEPLKPSQQTSDRDVLQQKAGPSGRDVLQQKAGPSGRDVLQQKADPSGRDVLQENGACIATRSTRSSVQSKAQGSQNRSPVTRLRRRVSDSATPIVGKKGKTLPQSLKLHSMHKNNRYLRNSTAVSCTAC